MAQNRTNNTSTYPNRPLSSACHAATENANESIRSGNRGEGGNCRRPEVQGGPGHAGVARNQRQRAHVSTAPIPSHPERVLPGPGPVPAPPIRNGSGAAGRRPHRPGRRRPIVRLHVANLAPGRLRLDRSATTAFPSHPSGHPAAFPFTFSSS